MLVATDGAPGLIRAVEECFPTSLRQRCLAHRMRTILAKLPEEAIDEFRQVARGGLLRGGLLFREERRRLGAGTVLGGGRIALKMMFASVIRGADRWRGIRITEFERRQPEKLRGIGQAAEPVPSSPKKKRTARCIQAPSR